jgi:hypothetical protein
LINTTTGGSGIHDSSLAYFDFCGSVEISATFNGGSIDNTTIQPDSYGIAPTISGGNNLKFTINKPQNLVIEVNGEIFNVVHLLSNTIETDMLAANATDVMYFGPGLHKVTGGLVSVPSNTIVYIAGGGVLNAELTFQNISNSVLRERGVVYHTSDHSILIENSTNIRVQDVISLNPGHYAIQAGEANGLTISNFRGFGPVGNGDGIDLFWCQNTLIDRVFMRNSDDNIAIYSHVSHKVDIFLLSNYHPKLNILIIEQRYNYYGNTSHINVQNSSLWADVAHPIVIGTHENTDDPETMSGITITNIDILDHREPQVDYQGCIALNPGDGNLIENVYIDDIRVENFRLGQLVNIRVMFNTMYNTSPGRGISIVHEESELYWHECEGRDICGV